MSSPDKIGNPLRDSGFLKSPDHNFLQTEGPKIAQKIEKLEERIKALKDQAPEQKVRFVYGAYKDLTSLDPRNRWYAILALKIFFESGGADFADFGFPLNKGADSSQFSNLPESQIESFVEELKSRALRFLQANNFEGLLEEKIRELQKEIIESQFPPEEPLSGAERKRLAQLRQIVFNLGIGALSPEEREEYLKLSEKEKREIKRKKRL